MTVALFRDDAYLRDAPARVAGHTPEGGIVLDGTIFYPAGGGQPGDSGTLEWQDQTLRIATAIRGVGDTIVLIPAEPAAMPALGAEVQQRIDWDRRYRHMRMHTALHLLSVVVPLPVTGGAVGPDKGRLDFDMPDPPRDRAVIEAELTALIEADLPVTDSWITDAELDANPGLVKTMSVAPPRGAGLVRLVRIGATDGDPVDLQPCGGTHVARTGEVGALCLGKIEKKGRRNRRVSLLFDN